MAGWVVEQIVHFAPGAFVERGTAHFGFHVHGRYYAIAHQRHYLGLVGDRDRVEWTVAPEPVFVGVPNVVADLEFPIYIDALPDESLLVSSFGNARLFRIDPEAMTSRLLVDGHRLGLGDMGNCVVDDQGFIWLNEVKGCRVWRFDQDGRPVETLGDGVPGFQPEVVGFEAVRFGWIYDLRRGPDRSIYVLDSGNYALRVIDIAARQVRTLAGRGTPGYDGDGENAKGATFGSDPAAPFDGPISLCLDEAGNAYIGDRFNHVVRMIDHTSGVISTIAGRIDPTLDLANDPGEREPSGLNLPAISSMDYHLGRLFVPTDLAGDRGDLVILRRA